MFSFTLDAIDKFEAEQFALSMLYDICAFLSVEFNILCSFILNYRFIFKS